MTSSHVLAILDLAGSVDAAVKELPDALGTAPYDLRLTLAAGLPAVVLITPDAERAAAGARFLRSRGHRAAHCDRAEVTPSAAMTELRDFEIEPSGIRATARSAELLAFADVGALVRAVLRTTHVTTEEVKERKFRPGMAIATSGLVLSKTTKKEVTTRVEERQQVLYVFPRGGAKPWILRERNARYGALGAELRPTSLENFATLTRRLRDAAPYAGYDERLLGPRALRGFADAVEGVDVLAHLVAVGFEAAR